MGVEKRGGQSTLFTTPPVITYRACIAGKKEGEGPIGRYIDHIEMDAMAGQKSWEEAESYLQQQVVEMLLNKANMSSSDIRFILSGDLLGQLIASSFALEKFNIPLIGLYGACSTMGESMAVGSMIVASGAADRVIAMTSSHFASAEKQFRFPLEYGSQRPLSATWTTTGSGGVILEAARGTNAAFLGRVAVTGATIGKIVDYGVKDSFNMGACMAPAAADVIAANLKDFGRKINDYDAVFTGDLGYIGRRILIKLLKEKNIDISEKHMDCGMILFDQKTQDTHAGGSGCGCSAVTLCAYIIKRMEEGYYRRVLFVPTGALLSTVSYNEGNTIPGIAHAVVLECIEKEMLR